MAEPYSGTRQQRKQRLVAMAAELLEEAGVRLGASADKSLFGILPGIVTDERGEKVYLDNELYDEVLEAFNYMYPLVGASAADKIEPQVGYQFSNDLCLKSGLVVASVESDLGTAAMMTHGFEPLPHARVSVDALAGGEPSGYEVARLDGKPAAERLQELTRDGMSRLERPVFGLPCGKDFNVIWPQQVHPGKDGIVRVKRKVALGDRLYVLNADPEHMLRAGAKALRGVIRRAGVDVSNLSLILGFSCVGRIQYYAAYNADWRAAISHLRESYMGVPLVWALSAGEFGIDEWRRNRANNMSISTICVANVHSRRAATRNFQNKLLEAGSQLITCATPRSVMETALAGAVEAGATGGQVCIVDGKLGRIIGKEHGYSLSPIGSPQDWPAVAKMTDRVISHREGGALPVYLEPWAMPVVSEADVHHARANHRPRHHEGEREDILPLIVRTLHAVYILDSRDPKFHCNHEAVERGNLGCQLAVPLVGSSGRAIATLQVSFAESKPIDRES
ncbi:MAG TPA: FIST N-terminal domain-containing protein, partial [Ardenticatenaceae bacterium]|nr:FIST N-terminal domain-containing protein [Ardenticatenaceae bacterium]